MRAVPLWLLCACASIRLGIHSVPGGPWHEYTSTHFILDTDVHAADAETIVERFEAMRAAVLRVLAGEDADFAGHIRLFIPASSGEYLELPNRETILAYYTHSFFKPIIVAPASACLDGSDVVAHELAHAVSEYLYPEQRAWFAEGLAQFVQSVGRSSPPSSVEHVAEMTGFAGEALPAHTRGGGADVKAMSVSRLLRLRGHVDTESAPAFYKGSWLLYHWLHDHRGKDLAAFQRRLADGAGFDEAFRATFPDLDGADPAQVAALDETLLAYGRAGVFPSMPVKARQHFGLQVQRISPGAVRLLRLAVRRDLGAESERQRVIRTEVEKALAEDPANAEAIVFSMAKDGWATLAGARAAVRAAPASYFGWFELSETTKDAAEKEGALRTAVSLAPECAVCQNNLAWLLAQSGRPAEAVQYANRALDLAPWVADFVDTLAEIALRLGDCGKALILRERAARMQNGRGKDNEAAVLTADRKRCGAQHGL